MAKQTNTPAATAPAGLAEQIKALIAQVDTPEERAALLAQLTGGTSPANSKELLEKAVKYLNTLAPGAVIGPVEIRDFKVHEQGGYVNVVLNSFQKFQIRLEILEGVTVDQPTEG